MIVWCQAIISNNANIMLIGPYDTNSSEIGFIQDNAYRYVICKMAAIWSQP